MEHAHQQAHQEKSCRVKGTGAAVQSAWQDGKGLRGGRKIHYRNKDCALKALGFKHDVLTI